MHKLFFLRFQEEKIIFIIGIWFFTAFLILKFLWCELKIQLLWLYWCQENKRKNFLECLHILLMYFPPSFFSSCCWRDVFNKLKRNFWGVLILYQLKKINLYSHTWSKLYIEKMFLRSTFILCKNFSPMH